LINLMAVFFLGGHYVTYFIFISLCSLPWSDGICPVGQRRPGDRDRRVRYDHSKALAQKLKQARKSFKFVTLKDGDHHLSNQKDRIKFLQEVEKFLAKNL
tara:strand:- start:3715 stop:4014 length:300 start_codon:yes stop_codon:yes gene_type:complete